MTKKLFQLLLLLVLTALPARGQFYTGGSDNGKLEWKQIETESYRIIYPSYEHSDFTAREVAKALERVKKAVGSTAGYEPGQMLDKKMPVVIHAFTADNNGMVTWTPRRLELQTVPDAYDPMPFNYIYELAIHESRHLAQMQLGHDPVFHIPYVMLGELVPGALSAIYGGPAFFEGDAVVTETALSRSGRGRSADFLEYIRTAFDSGDTRDWWRWRYGSIKHYTPDYYKIGYVTVGGLRTFFDSPTLSGDFYRGITGHKGWRLNAFDKTVREATGMPFSSAFAAVCDSLCRIWDQEALGRAPYTPSERVSGPSRLYSEYKGPVAAGDVLYVLRSAMDSPGRLMKISPDGREEEVCIWSGTVSRPQFCEHNGRIYWSEYRRDPRWENESRSLIRYMAEPGKKVDLTSEGRLYNPAPSPVENVVAATEYAVDGISSVVFLDADSGRRIVSYPMENGVQAVETAWIGDQAYISAITPDGFGIFRLNDMLPLLKPQPVKIKQLGSKDGILYFVSDHSGVNELYSLNPTSGGLTRLTSSRTGTSEYAFMGDELYFAQPRDGGRVLCKTPVDSLENREVTLQEWAVPHRYVMAEELSAGEPLGIDDSLDVRISNPEPYSKFRHLINVHSWAPVFVNYDAVSSMSFEDITSDANLGATAFFQNELGTAYGYAGIRLLDGMFSFRPSLHGSFTYAGKYPVFEAAFNINGRNQKVWTVGWKELEDGKTARDMETAVSGNPSISGHLKTYIPLMTSSGGWSRGFIPQINLSWSNDLAGFEERSVSLNRSLVVTNVRAYIVSSTPQSCIYPKYGIGIETGYGIRPFVHDIFCSNLYAHTYGYLPGITGTQGLRMSGSVVRRMSDGMYCEPIINTAPRGFSQHVTSSVSAYPFQAKLTLDYAVPFASMDWGGLCPLAYLRNLELIPHYDWSFFHSDRSGNHTLWSAGADLRLVLGNLAWVPYTTRIGLSWSYNGGSLLPELREEELVEGRHYVGMIFSVDL